MKTQSQSTLSPRRQQRPTYRAPSALSGFCLAFGRYLGVPLSQIPMSYLRWALTVNVSDTDRWAIERYLRECGSPRRRQPARPQEGATPANGAGA
jgi:hypothetical protein